MRGPLSRATLGFLLASAAIVLLAIFLRFETYAQRPLWFDERITMALGTRISLANFLEMARSDSFEHPPLYPLIVSWFQAWLGTKNGVRVPSLVFGIATVPVLIALGSRLFDRRVGLVAGLLLGLSVYHVNYSQDARAYALLVATTTAQYALLVEYRRGGRLGWLVPFALLGLVSLYAHHMGLLVQAGLGATCGALLLLDAYREGAARGELRRSLLVWSVVWAAVALLYLPQALHVMSWVAGVQEGSEQHTLRISLHMLHDVAARWGGGPGIAAGYDLLFAIGLASLWRRSEAALILLVWLAVPFLALAVVPFDHFFDLRYVITALPVFLLLIARGAVVFADGLGSAFAPNRAGLLPRQRVQAAALVLTVLLLAGFSVSSYASFRRTDRRCSDFPTDRTLLTMEDGYCQKQLLLNTLLESDRYLLAEP